MINIITLLNIDLAMLQELPLTTFRINSEFFDSRLKIKFGCYCT